MTVSDNKYKMGTRGLYVFRYTNKWYVFYNHCDSYPEGLGQKIVNELKTLDWDEVKHLVELINDSHVDGSCADLRYKGLMMALKSPSDYMLQGIDDKFVPSKYDHEYAYVINLDANMFEICYFSNDYEQYNVQRFTLTAVPENWAEYML